ncbi:MAG: two-component sensor histidine kinase [Actinomycetales bacterium]|nr:MAG: two-component sensor histidine kinase [Actinomycetales bacterium]
MRRVMMRATGNTVLASILIVGVPTFGLLLWITTTRPDRVNDWLALPVTDRAVHLGGVFVVVVLVGSVTSIFIGRQASREVVEAIGQLADQAELMGTGRAPSSQPAIGIDEIDRVRVVLARSASQLARSLAAEQGFASEASHQLRTPLTALLMRIEEIAGTDDLHVAHTEAQVAIDQVERLSRVVDDLLTRRRSTPSGELLDVSLDSVMGSLQREWRPAFEAVRRRVRVHGDRGLVVRATPVALSQVLSTLLENSLLHGTGTVDVRVRHSGPSVVVEVGDEGEGVPAALAPHIFERSVSSGGSGLGLALARDLTESFGGRLDLVSRQPATFALFLSEAPGIAS